MMDYNFSSISVDTIVDVEKKLRRIKENTLSDINNFIHVLNDKQVIEKRGELNTVVGDIMNDEIKKITLLFTECMNKVQRTLAQYL